MSTSAFASQRMIPISALDPLKSSDEAALALNFASFT